MVRTVYPTVPPRVEYALTPTAETLIPALLELIAWAEAHAGEVGEETQAPHDGRSPGGASR